MPFSKVSESDTDAEVNVRIKIQDTLVSINDITSKMINRMKFSQHFNVNAFRKKEFDLIEGLVKEDGQLREAVNTANKTLFRKADEMGLDVENIVSETRRKDRLETDSLGLATSSAITEQLLKYMDG